MLKLILFAVLFTQTITMTTSIKTRDEIPKEDKWNVESMYPSVEEWSKEFNKANDAKST